MSISFDEPLNDDAKKRMRELLGEAVAEDDKTFLFDNLRVIKQKEMKELANLAKQPATVGLHKQDEIVTMSDGTKYRATPQGWRKEE